MKKRLRHRKCFRFALMAAGAALWGGLFFLGPEKASAQSPRGHSDPSPTDITYESSRVRFELRSDRRGIAIKSHLLSLRIQTVPACRRPEVAEWIAGLNQAVEVLQSHGQSESNRNATVLGRGRWIRLNQRRLWISSDDPGSRSALFVLDSVPAEFHFHSVRVRQACGREKEVL